MKTNISGCIYIGVLILFSINTKIALQILKLQLDWNVVSRRR
jgi:hypothetical protein